MRVLQLPGKALSFPMRSSRMWHGVCQLAGKAVFFFQADHLECDTVFVSSPARPSLKLSPFQGDHLKCANRVLGLSDHVSTETVFLFLRGIISCVAYSVRQFTGYVNTKTISFPQELPSMWLTVFFVITESYLLYQGSFWMRLLVFVNSLAMSLLKMSVFHENHFEYGLQCSSARWQQ